MGSHEQPALLGYHGNLLQRPVVQLVQACVVGRGVGSVVVASCGVQLRKACCDVVHRHLHAQRIEPEVGIEGAVAVTFVLALALLREVLDLLYGLFGVHLSVADGRNQIENHRAHLLSLLLFFALRGLQQLSNLL